MTSKRAAMSIEVATNYTKDISARVNFRKDMDVIKLNLIGKNISKFTGSYVQLVNHYLINHPNIKEGIHAASAKDNGSISKLPSV